MGTCILPKNDRHNDTMLGWALWHLVFNVSTVVRDEVTKTVPENVEKQHSNKIIQLDDRAPDTSSSAVTRLPFGQITSWSANQSAT